jgi:hypothetical protein
MEDRNFIFGIYTKIYQHIPLLVRTGVTETTSRLICINDLLPQFAFTIKTEFSVRYKLRVKKQWSIKHDQWYKSRITFDEIVIVNLPLTVPQ